MQQFIHDLSTASSSVKNISNHMQMVNQQPPDTSRQAQNKGRRFSQLNHISQDILKIGFFISQSPVTIEQFLDNIGILWRQGLSDLGATVFGTCKSQQVQELGNGFLIPVFAFSFFPQHKLRIGNQR